MAASAVNVCYIFRARKARTVTPSKKVLAEMGVDEFIDRGLSSCSELESESSSELMEDKKKARTKYTMKKPRLAIASGVFVLSCGGANGTSVYQTTYECCYGDIAGRHIHEVVHVLPLFPPPLYFLLCLSSMRYCLVIEWEGLANVQDFGIASIELMDSFYSQFTKTRSD